MSRRSPRHSEPCPKTGQSGDPNIWRLICSVCGYEETWKTCNCDCHELNVPHNCALCCACALIRMQRARHALAIAMKCARHAVALHIESMTIAIARISQTCSCIPHLIFHSQMRNNTITIFMKYDSFQLEPHGSKILIFFYSSWKSSKWNFEQIS